MTVQNEPFHAARAAKRFEALIDATERTNEALTNAVNALRAEVAALVATVPNAPLGAREVGVRSSRAVKLAYTLETALLRRTHEPIGNARIELEPQDAY